MLKHMNKFNFSHKRKASKKHTKMPSPTSLQQAANSVGKDVKK